MIYSAEPYISLHISCKNIRCGKLANSLYLLKQFAKILDECEVI